MPNADNEGNDRERLDDFITRIEYTKSLEQQLVAAHNRECPGKCWLMRLKGWVVGAFMKMRLFLFLACFAVLFPLAAGAAVRDVQDNYLFGYHVIDSDGNHVTGQTVALKIMRASDGYWFDFSDSTFKNSGWSSKSANLSEDSTEGRYYYTWNPPASETGAEQYLFCADNADATYGDHQCETVDYQNIGTGTSTFTAASDTVIVGTNNDKTGYGLSAAAVDAVWDEAISGHLTSGTTGAKLNSAGAAGNIWETDISTGYTGQAGEYLRQVYRLRR